MSEERVVKVSTEVPLRDGKKIHLKPKIRSSFFARFREANPAAMEAVTSAFESGSEGFRAKVGEAIMKGLPAGEVVNLCAFLGEVTKTIEGFGDEYSWGAMSDEEKTDFFDLELSDVEKFSCLIVVYVHHFMKA